MSERAVQTMTALETFGYSLTMRGDWIGDLWARLWFRWYCLYPLLLADKTAKACIAAGKCGCSNCSAPALANPEKEG